MNPLYQERQIRQNPQIQSQFDAFKKDLQCDDAQAKVLELLNSGKMSFAQFKELVPKVNMYSQILK